MGRAARKGLQFTHVREEASGGFQRTASRKPLETGLLFFRGDCSGPNFHPEFLT
jgi:hypothetical protein